MKYLAFLPAALLSLCVTVACEKGQSDPNPGDNRDITGGDGGDSQAPADSPKNLAKGERGTSCNVSSDCVDDLSCIVQSDCFDGACVRKTCQPSNFDLVGTGKQCALVECATTADCCGEKPTVEPAKCAGRQNICFTPSLPECSAILCDSATDCGGGASCGGGTCSNDGVSTSCDSDADCDLTCTITVPGTNGMPDTGYCANGITACSLDSDCAANTCRNKRCDCSNPLYDTTNPICTDTECGNLCLRVCEGEKCVVDTSCEEDLECPLATPICDDGNCVECTSNSDCDEDAKEECVAGSCDGGCKSDGECQSGELCKTGECVYVGCQTDRECILSTVSSSIEQDPRLAKCSIKNGIGECTFPCEQDAQCDVDEVCLENTCQYIGCETNAECKTITGLHNQPAPTPDRPWTTTTECRADEPASN